MPPTTARNPVAAAALAALAAVASPASSAADDSARAVKATRFAVSADRAFEKGDLLRAKNFYERALSFFPDHPDARVGMGRIMMMERKYEAALNHYERARDAYSGFADVLADRAVRNYAEAQDEIARLRDRRSQLQQQLNRAQTQGRNVRPGGPGRGLEMAINTLDNRIRRLEALEPPGRFERPEPPAAIHFSVGNALFHLERYGEAIESWVRCVEAEPRFAPAYNNLALVHGMFARFDEARTWIRRAEEREVALNENLLRDLAELEESTDVGRPRAGR